jgi:DivIVA domain-containing protein
MSEELMRPGEGLFNQARRGYDRDEVDAYVSQLQYQIRDLQSQIQRHQSPDAAVASALDRVGSEVAEVLKQATTTRDGIIAKAEDQAAELKADAEAHAAHVTSVAEQRVHELDLDTDRIWAERERIVADARDLARQLQAVADLAAERFPDENADSRPTGGDQEDGLGFGGGEAVSGFDELNADA